MKKKLLITAMLAVLLAFGFTFVSCGNDPGDPPAVPPRFAGTWDSIPTGILEALVMHTPGTGTVLLHNNEVPTAFRHFTDGRVEKLEMIVAPLTVELPVIGDFVVTTGGQITFDISLNADGNLVLENPAPAYGADPALVVFAGLQPYRRNVQPETTPIPAELEGAWEGTAYFAGQVVFVINDTAPQVMASAPEQWADGIGILVPCVWSVDENRLTLTVMGLTNTFTWAINAEDQLVLSDPTATNALAGYVLWGPFNRVATP